MRSYFHVFVGVLLLFVSCVSRGPIDDTLARLEQHKFVPVYPLCGTNLIPVGAFFAHTKGTDVASLNPEVRDAAFVIPGHAESGPIGMFDLEQTSGLRAGFDASVSQGTGSVQALIISSNHFRFINPRANFVRPADLRLAVAFYNPAANRYEIRPEFCQQVQTLPKSSFILGGRARVAASAVYGRVAATVYTVDGIDFEISKQAVASLKGNSGTLQIEGVPVSANLTVGNTNNSTVKMKATFDQPMVVGFRPTILRISVEGPTTGTVEFQ